MDTFRLKTENKIKKIAVFQIIRLIKYASLEDGLYKSQNIKIDYKINVLDEIMNFFKIKAIFNKNWVRNNDTLINILSTTDYVRDQIHFINDRNEKNRWKEYLIERYFYLHTTILLIKTQIPFITLSSFGRVYLQQPNSILMLSILGL